MSKWMALLLGCNVAFISILANAAPFAYVTNNAGSTNTVSVIDVATNTIMLQVARNLVDAETGMLPAKRDLIIDRDTKYALSFRGTPTIAANDGLVYRRPRLGGAFNFYTAKLRDRRDRIIG